jgi:uncharacterized protein YceH (UPF0502 family)
MNVSIPSLLLGAAGVGVGYFVCLWATKGISAAWAWLKAKFAAASAELATLRGELESRVTALETDVAALKKAAPPTAAAQ